MRTSVQFARFPAALVLFALALAGCGGAAPAASAPSAAGAPAHSSAASPPVSPSPQGTASAPAGAPSRKPAPAGQLTKVQIAYSPPTAYSATTFEALDGGFFKKYGVDAQLEALDSGTLIQAVVSGSVPFGMGATSNALNAAAAGGAIKAVASVNNSSGIVMIAQPSIKSVADLKGKTIAVAQPLSSSDFVARLILKQHGLVYNKDVHVLNAGNAPGQAAALTSGQVAAITQTGDVAVALQAQGDKILVNFPQQHTPFNEEALLVNPGYARAHPAVVLGVIKGIWEGTQAVLGSYNTYTQAARKHLQAVTDPQLKGNYDVMRLVWAIPANPRVTRASLKTIVGLLSASNPKIAGVKYGTFVDNSYLAKLKTEGYFKGGGCQGC